VSRLAVMDPITGDWVEVTEEGIRLGLSLDDAAKDIEIARLRDDLDSESMERADAELVIKDQEEALALMRAAAIRLRKIEEAARDLSRVGEVHFDEDQVVATVPARKMLALRAALGGTPDDK
jgi:hypothetical protein